jgi:hypothetical protein
MSQALALIPISARSVVPLNAVIVVSRVLYVGSLILFGAGSSSPALRFGRLYAAGHAIYFLMMIILCGVLYRQERFVRPAMRIARK